jgi:hypothetical protein
VLKEWWRTIVAVLWSFLGIRRQNEHHKDMASLKPLPVIIVGLVLALLFVWGLIVWVNYLVDKGA